MLKLHAESVTLANGVTRRYGGHKVPCCAECNAMLGARIEVPASRLLKAGYARMREKLDSDGFQLLHAWAALVFLKMHLKDSKMPWSLDNRMDAGKIGEVYSSDELHHIQSIVRTKLLEGWVEQEVRGTCFVHQASKTEFDQPFDYADNSRGCASMIRVGDQCIFNVFDDASIVAAAINGLIARCGPLSSPQARELLTHLAYTNIRIVRRPRFWTNVFSGTPVIDGFVPEPYEIRRYVPSVWGSMLYHANRDHLEGVNVEELKNGHWTYLLRDDGSFIETFKRAPTQSLAETTHAAGMPER